MTTRSQTNSLKPRTPYVGCVNPFNTEPSCFTEFSKHSHWCGAMHSEFNALIQNGTWDLVPSRPEYNLVSNKWVYRIKRNADGSIEHFKARLVPKGFHQQEGVDFTEMFSPVVKPSTIHLFISLSVSNNWSL